MRRVRDYCKYLYILIRFHFLSYGSMYFILFCVVVLGLVYVSLLDETPSDLVSGEVIRRAEAERTPYIRTRKLSYLVRTENGNCLTESIWRVKIGTRVCIQPYHNKKYDVISRCKVVSKRACE